MNYKSFQRLFYPTGTNLILDPKVIRKSTNKKFTSLTSKYRKTLNGYPFELYESILVNIETDLCVTRDMFTKDSLVSLTKELGKIRYLSDIKSYCLDDALPWPDLLHFVHNEYIKQKEHPENLSRLEFNLSSGDSVKVQFIINMAFKSLNMTIKPTVVKMNYVVSFPKTYLDQLNF